ERSVRDRAFVGRRGLIPRRGAVGRFGIAGQLTAGAALAARRALLRLLTLTGDRLLGLVLESVRDVARTVLERHTALARCLAGLALLVQAGSLGPRRRVVVNDPPLLTQ